MSEAQESSLDNIKLYGKYSYDGVVCTDYSLVDYICIKNSGKVFTAHSAKRWNKKRFRKSQCPVTERIVNSLMMHGRNNGKKLKANKILRDACDIIHLSTGLNPIQVIVDAVRKGGCREDATRTGGSGMARRQAVDVSPYRRVNEAIYYITQGARKAAMKNTKTMAECLADELINCSRESSSSFAIKKKDEIERVAKVNR